MRKSPSLAPWLVTSALACASAASLGCSSPVEPTQDPTPPPQAGESSATTPTAPAADHAADPAKPSGSLTPEGFGTPLSPIGFTLPGFGAPFFAPPTWVGGWLFSDTFNYTGGNGSYLDPVYPANANYVLYEAPVWCAPRMVSAYVSTTPFNALQPLVFVGQREVGAVIQALYRTQTGFAYPVTGVGGTLSGFVACPIRAYTILD